MTAKLKLIVSDLDGTLLPSREKPPDADIIDMIRDVDKAGVKFAIASGRQYPNLCRLFYEVRDRVIFLPENGSWISLGDKTLYEASIERRDAMELIGDILRDAGCEALVSSKYTYYINPRTERFFKRMFGEIKATLTKVDSFDDIREPILKVSAYYREGVGGGESEELREKWSHRLSAAVSGGTWIDFTVGDKGKAVDFLMQYLGVKPEETAVFGDDNNDIPMLKATSNSWCTEGAEETVKRSASFVTGSVVSEIRKLVSEQ